MREKWWSANKKSCRCADDSREHELSQRTPAARVDGRGDTDQRNAEDEAGERCAARRVDDSDGGEGEREHAEEGKKALPPDPQCEADEAAGQEKCRVRVVPVERAQHRQGRVLATPP